MPLKPSQSPSDRPARIGAGAVREIAQQALRVQRSIPISLDRGRRGDRGPFGMNYGPIFPGLIPAVVTTAITACGTQSTPVPGSGAAQLWYRNDDAAAMAQNGDDGASGIVPVLNWYAGSGTIAVGTHVLVASFSNSFWLIGSDC
jgi:hypothetical protein